MESTSSEIVEEPVLLSWELPARRRKLFVILFWLLILPTFLGMTVLFLYIAGGDPSHERLLNRVSPWFLLIAWLSVIIACMPVYTGAVRIECRSSGIVLTMLLTGRRRMRWDEIVRLRKNRLGYIILQYGDRGRDYVYLPIPRDVLDKLIAILRETSNARIVGFGPEES